LPCEFVNQFDPSLERHVCSWHIQSDKALKEEVYWFRLDPDRPEKIAFDIFIFLIRIFALFWRRLLPLTQDRHGHLEVALDPRRRLFWVRQHKPLSGERVSALPEGRL
jgi:hypothetical protein